MYDTESEEGLFVHGLNRATSDDATHWEDGAWTNQMKSSFNSPFPCRQKHIDKCLSLSLTYTHLEVYQQILWFDISVDNVLRAAALESISNLGYVLHVHMHEQIQRQVKCFRA